MNHSPQRGSIILLVIIFGAIFFTMLLAMSSFVLTQNRAQDSVRSKSESFTVAEAGLDYYRWLLSHFPGDTMAGTGHAGPYVSTYADPEYGTAGTYTMTVSGNSSCGSVQSIDVTSVGVANDTPTVPVTLTARFAPPSVAAYSMIVGASTWFDGTTFTGPMQSNGGLRMDNTTNNAPITSSLQTWSCDNSFGCSPTVTKPGIFGTGANQNLWKFPQPQMDFPGIASDFTQLKAKAVANGLYFARVSSNGNPNIGYHLIFNGNTVTVKKVTAVTTLPNVLYNSTQTWQNDYTLISAEQQLGVYPIPAACSLIFVEDNAWIEGSISTKVTLVAANVLQSGVTPSIVLTNNITYTVFDGSVGLTAIAAKDVLIGPNTPQDLTLDGIFVAQTGSFGRNLYGCDVTSRPYQYKNKLTMLGTIVSLLRQNNYWSGGCDSGQGYWSGYPDSLWTFVSDRNLSSSPPAFTPSTSLQWQFVDWKQQ